MPPVTPGVAGKWSVLFLIGITLFAYAPLWHLGFVNYDDPQYVTQNPNVTAGLRWDGIKWAFTTGYQANWHPLTWLSHMIDVQLFGGNAGAHHLTNLAFHIANTVLLFWFLLQITGARGPSTVIAALFAVHPLHVESVAWIAERKDVLSTFFWMLTLCAYVLYVRWPRLSAYLGVMGFFALGLMAKPMLVTLPFVLLLLDFWPLRRLTLRDTSNLPRLILEKVPLLVLTAISSVVTFLVQKTGGAVVRTDAIPIAARFANGFIAYFEYLQRMLWPARLTILYPAVLTPRDWWWLAALGVASISIFAVWAAERRPYIPVGWFWYLGTLVPVIGLIQVGRQATADRYTYVPLIGLFLVVVLGVSDALAGVPRREYFLLIAGGLAIAACIWGTRRQLQYWTGSHALWAHALELTTGNELAEFNLAVALQDEGKIDDAIVHFSEAVRLEPFNANAQYSLGSILVKSNRSLDEAAAHLARAIQEKPDFAEAHDDLGIDYLLQGKLDQAVSEFSEAIRLKPDFARAHNNLGTALGDAGQLDHAISEYTEALRLDPSLTDAHINLGILLARKQKVE